MTSDIDLTMELYVRWCSDGTPRIVGCFHAADPDALGAEELRALFDNGAWDVADMCRTELCDRIRLLLQVLRLMIAEDGVRRTEWENGRR